MRYLITGHTGFKGAWLSAWLGQEGHEVHGLSLDPEPGSLYVIAGLADFLARDIRGDVRDAATVREAVKAADPEVLIHLAAQPLVRESYREPRWTMETNVLGTLNVLEASNAAPNLKAQLVITTDKVYRNTNQVTGYTEDDPLGGDDPYSASKAMADILVQSWVKSFGGPTTAIARAGNVIGGGDVCKERLFPDIVKALASGRAPELRYPEAVRPWQHVLDCLQGYRSLISRMISSDSHVASGSSWNFGPDENSFVSVSTVTGLASQRWGAHQPWSAAGAEFGEAGLLALDAGKAQRELGWRNLLPLEEAVNWTIDWFRSVERGGNPREETFRQISLFDHLVTSS